MSDAPIVRAHPAWLAWANRPGRAVGISLAVSLVVALATLLLNGNGELGWRAVTRLTAQVAFPLFLAAFLASSLARLWPGPRTRALLARRRALGLAFATAQTVHGIAILLLARFHAGTSESVLAPDPALYGGALGFVLMFAMAATSNDAAQRRLGGPAWRALHRSGQIVLFVIYCVTYGGRVANDAAYWPGAALLVAAAGLRIAAAFQGRGADPSRSLRSRTLPIE